MTKVLFEETAAKEVELLEQDECRLNVSGVPRKLGVSRSGRSEEHTSELQSRP